MSLLACHKTMCTINNNIVYIYIYMYETYMMKSLKFHKSQDKQ